MQATAHILREEGADALSTNRVAKRAGVSIGSLYQYFPNKEALLLALAQEHSDSQVRRFAELMGQVAGLPIPEAARRFVEATVTVHRTDPQLHLAITSEVLVRGMGTALADHRRGRELLAFWLRARAAEVRVADPEMTAFMLVTAVESSVHAALFEDPALLDDPRFVNALVAMVVRTLGA